MDLYQLRGEHMKIQKLIIITLLAVLLPTGCSGQNTTATNDSAEATQAERVNVTSAPTESETAAPEATAASSAPSSQRANICLKCFQMSLFKPILSKGDCALTTTSPLFPSSFRLFVVAVVVKKCPLPKRSFSAPAERGFVLCRLG